MTPAIIRKGAMGKTIVVVITIIIDSEGKASRCIILYASNGISKHVRMGTDVTDGMFVGRVRKQVR